MPLLSLLNCDSRSLLDSSAIDDNGDDDSTICGVVVRETSAIASPVQAELIAFNRISMPYILHCSAAER